MATESLVSVLWSSRLIVLLLSMLIYSFDAVLYNSWTSFVANTFLSFIFSPLVGDLSDTYGRKPFIISGLLLSALPVGIVFLYLTQGLSLLWYYPCNALTSIVPIIVVFLSYTADVLQPQHRTAGFGLIIAAFSLGFTVGPQIGGFLQPHTAALVAGGGCLLSTAVVVLAVPESKYPAEHTSVTPSEPSKQRPVDALLSIRRSWALINSSILFRRLALCMAIVGIVSEGVQDMLTQYLQLVVGFTTRDQSRLITTLGASNLIVQAALLPLLASVLGERLLLLFGLSFYILQQVLLAVTVSKWQAFAAVSLGSLAGVSFPAISSIKSTHTRADQQGLVQGALAGIRALATGLGPLAFAQLFAMCTKTTAVLGYKPGLVFWTTGALALSAAAVAASIPARLVRRPGQLSSDANDSAAADGCSAAAAAAPAGDHVAISVDHHHDDLLRDHHDDQDATKSGGSAADKQTAAAKHKSRQQQQRQQAAHDVRGGSVADPGPMLCAAAAAAWQEDLQSGLQSAPSFMVRRAIMRSSTDADQRSQQDLDQDLDGDQDLDEDDVDHDGGDQGVQEPLLRRSQDN